MPRAHKVLGIGHNIPDPRNPSKKLKAVMDHKAARQKQEDLNRRKK